MKQWTTLNTPVGAIVGALPPMIGWVAACGTDGVGMYALAALLYLWQMPHFHSLSYNLRDDYDKGKKQAFLLTLGFFIRFKPLLIFFFFFFVFVLVFLFVKI
jgi:protoheme IX farnesyltransferase